MLYVVKIWESSSEDVVSRGDDDDDNDDDSDSDDDGNEDDNEDDVNVNGIIVEVSSDVNGDDVDGNSVEIVSGVAEVKIEESPEDDNVWAEVVSSCSSVVGDIKVVKISEDDNIYEVSKTSVVVVSSVSSEVVKESIGVKEKVVPIEVSSSVAVDSCSVDDDELLTVTSWRFTWYWR